MSSLAKVPASSDFLGFYLLSFSVPGPQPGCKASVLTSPQALLAWDSLLDFSWFLWLGQSGGGGAYWSDIVERPLTGICLTFFSWFNWGCVFGGERPLGPSVVFMALFQGDLLSAWLWPWCPGWGGACQVLLRSSSLSLLHQCSWEEGSPHFRSGGPAPPPWGRAGELPTVFGTFCTGRLLSPLFIYPGSDLHPCRLMDNYTGVIIRYSTIILLWWLQLWPIKSFHWFLSPLLYPVFVTCFFF